METVYFDKLMEMYNLPDELQDHILDYSVTHVNKKMINDIVKSDTFQLLVLKLRRNYILKQISHLLG